MPEIWIYECRWPLRAVPSEEVERQLHEAGLSVVHDGIPVSLEPNAGRVPAAALAMLGEVAPISAEMAHAVWWRTEYDVEMHVSFVVRGEMKEIVFSRPRADAAERQAARRVERWAADERLARVRADVVDPARQPGRRVRYGLDLVKAMPAEWSDERRLAHMVEQYDVLVDAFLDLDERSQRPRRS